MDDADLHAVADRIEVLLEELRASSEGRVWMRIEELVRLLTELYGAGMGRTVELLGDDPGFLRRLADDDLVGNLLVLHDLHPDDLTTRAARAVEAMAPSVRKGGAEISVASVEPGAVTVTVKSSSAGCGSTAGALGDTVANALSTALPDVDSVDVKVQTVPEPTPIHLGRKPASAGTGPVIGTRR